MESLTHRVLCQRIELEYLNRDENEMDSNNKELVDWTHLPANTATTSLWDTLHDGGLLSVVSDRLKRTLTFQFEVGYLRDFHKLADDCLFTVEVCGVQSVRALTYVPWPGDFILPEGASRSEERELVAEYQSKWREESMSWSKFEESVGSGEFKVLDSKMAYADSGIALSLLFSMKEGSTIEVFIRGLRAFFQVDESKLSLEEFAALGEEYWNKFADGKS